MHGVVQRESPFVLQLEDGRTLEGAVDLAYLEDGGWVIVDFKTDLDLEDHRDKYCRQVAWYQLALEQLTGLPARGVVLGV